MNEEELKTVHELLKSFADQIAKSPASLLDLYIKDCENVEKGLMDSSLFSTHPIDKVKAYKRDRIFYSQLATKIIDTRELIKQYLIETGQLKVH
jgi:hypothetical protein